MNDREQTLTAMRCNWPACSTTGTTDGECREQACPDHPPTPTTDLQPGVKVQDNDPRMPGRVLEVASIVDGMAFLQTPGKKFGRLTIIKTDRIHTDGKPRRSGWSVING